MSGRPGIGTAEIIRQFGKDMVRQRNVAELFFSKRAALEVRG